ncbi:rhamnulokinase [Acutalibacter sp. 1XD8-36]|uniref:rhamnulokinase n=1 Tax=Acutalibacter sp. 1XD8-36 TaxID=2320852 RepID=UPI00262F15BE|nr:rhamnulokinase family protein [Acutalibacter sp. 1XD8-36]
MKYYLAIDIGASSGRHIIGWQEDGALRTEEVYRFKNGVTERDGHLTWDIDRLEREVRAGIDTALGRYPRIESLSVDTWGVDYVLLRGDRPVLPCYAYRDSRTEVSIPRVHEIIPFPELYARTGIQFQTFNTIYQLYADKLSGRLEGATGYLMMPEYLMWRLCGGRQESFTGLHEYTIATTTGLVNARTGEFDLEIIRRLGLPEELFTGLSQPGTVVGEYKGIRVVLCPTHDTASAVEGIPMETDAAGSGEGELFLSSGTWSLLGAKLQEAVTTPESLEANFSNEGGVGYIRCLKNIMGMWMVNNLREELCPGEDFSAITESAGASAYQGLVDVTAQRFMAPESMSGEICRALEESGYTAPESPGDYFRCAYRSLARCYGESVRVLEGLTGRRYSKLYIVGGGAKNQYLNRLTEEETGLKVVALPIEATALGNLNSQITAQKSIKCSAAEAVH